MFGKLRRVEKEWGHELWVHNSPMYCGKILVVKPGRQCSFHYHARKHETFILVEGRCLIFLGERGPVTMPPPAGWVTAPGFHEVAVGEWHVLEPGSTIEIQPYQVHAIKALDEPARIIEFSTQHTDDDSYRVGEPE
jgi:D-lyxose ketol-isomerase